MVSSHPSIRSCVPNGSDAKSLTIPEHIRKFVFVADFSHHLDPRGGRLASKAWGTDSHFRIFAPCNNLNFTVFLKKTFSLTCFPFFFAFVFFGEHEFLSYSLIRVMRIKRGYLINYTKRIIIEESAVKTSSSKQNCLIIKRVCFVVN